MALEIDSAYCDDKAKWRQSATSRCERCDDDDKPLNQARLRHQAHLVTQSCYDSPISSRLVLCMAFLRISGQFLALEIDKSDRPMVGKVGA